LPDDLSQFTFIFSEVKANRGISLVLNGDSESAWSLSGDWQRIASLIVAVAYLLISPILFPANSWSHLMADIIMRILSLAFPLACIWFADDLGELLSGWQPVSHDYDAESGKIR